MKDKQGNKVGFKEFFARWKEGINNITPTQKLKNDLISTSIVLVGYIIGIVTLIVFWERLIVGWFALGLICIFAGMAWTTTFKILGIRQQLRLFRGVNLDAIDVNKIISNLESKK